MQENPSNREALIRKELAKKNDEYNNFLELRNNIIRESLNDIESTEHRLEFITEINGVDYINDSKATTVDLSWYSLESIDRPLIWIVGGVDDRSDYSMLKEIVRDKVKVIICLGKENRKVFKTFMSDVDLIVAADTAEEAVKQSNSLALKGDTVLLSPACASYDLFTSYEDRGNKFRSAVTNLKNSLKA
jgi:UDP-N-acetylmuramoylalanine--D-glutamate ligase